MNQFVKAAIIAAGLLYLVMFLAERANAGWSFDGPLDNEINCLALNIYFEARAESERGQLAVAHVTWNRVNSEHYPDSICGVVWQQNEHRKTGNVSAQFSWTLDGKSDRPKNKDLFEQIKRLATMFLVNKPEDFTGGATHYHANYVNPYWAKSLRKLVQVDTHIFYR